MDRLTIIKYTDILSKRLSDKGLTLIEVLLVVLILGILAAIVVPTFFGLVEKAEQDVCDVNVIQLERMYESYLVLENIDHSDVVFTQYLLDYGENICDDCDLSYVDGKVICNVQSSDEDEDEGVPFF
ncbi:prepilin-type N-terminal cleavage/methylation domain-containing protein [Alkalihalobacillus deserti]|uniref:prepilin-type N-terminal cleavage/methylation domain-containing protein n=1 Tax=Alkalihalobacillus deserti TaxID=2879466 RepID=UPI001D14A6AE|nr:prepilin-type N-terminal cleavage/methylation domain-containing protein [Alkalihalobacillus deserti]